MASVRCQERGECFRQPPLRRILNRQQQPFEDTLHSSQNGKAFRPWYGRCPS